MSSKQNPSGKEMTYEAIGKKLNISPQQVHKIEKEASNKVIRRIMEVHQLDIFDAIVKYSKLFGIEMDHCYKKLDSGNLELLDVYITENH